MALTAAQTTQFFEILGIPQNGAGDVFSSVATLFGPAYETYDCSGIVSKVNTRLSALTTSQETRVTALLTRWDAITSYSPLQVNQNGDTSGRVVDYPQERENIRRSLGDLVGVAVPSGGFTEEARRLRRNAGSIVR